MPAVMPDVLGDLGPGFRPPVTAGDRPQRNHWIDMGPGPVHPRSFQSLLNHQVIGTFDTATPNRIATRLVPGIVQHPAPLLQIVQTRLDGGEGCQGPAPLGHGGQLPQGFQYHRRIPRVQGMPLDGEPPREGRRPFPIHGLARVRDIFVPGGAGTCRAR